MQSRTTRDGEEKRRRHLVPGKLSQGTNNSCGCNRLLNHVNPIVTRKVETEKLSLRSGLVNKSKKLEMVGSTCPKKDIGGFSRLANKSFYLDIERAKSYRQLEEDIKLLGGNVEKCFTKDLSFVITEKGTELDYRNSKAPSDGSPFTSCSEASPATPSKPTVVTTANTRAKRLVEAASKVGSLSSALLLAKKWNIKVVHVDKVKKAIATWKRLLPQHITEKQVTKLSNDNAIVVAARKLDGCYIKCEDASRKFRPLVYQDKTFPTIDGWGPSTGSPFEQKRCRSGVQGNANRQFPPRSRKNIDEAAKKCEEARDQPNKGHSVAFCEICNVTFLELAKHISSKKHQDFVNNLHNYYSLDQAINKGLSIENMLRQFGHDLSDDFVKTSSHLKKMRKLRRQEDPTSPNVQANEKHDNCNCSPNVQLEISPQNCRSSRVTKSSRMCQNRMLSKVECCENPPKKLEDTNLTDCLNTSYADSLQDSVFDGGGTVRRSTKENSSCQTDFSKCNSSNRDSISDFSIVSNSYSSDLAASPGKLKPVKHKMVRELNGILCFTANLAASEPTIQRNLSLSYGQLTRYRLSINESKSNSEFSDKENCKPLCNSMSQSHESTALGKGKVKSMESSLANCRSLHNSSPLTTTVAARIVTKEPLLESDISSASFSSCSSEKLNFEKFDKACEVLESDDKHYHDSSPCKLKRKICDRGKDAAKGRQVKEIVTSPIGKSSGDARNGPSSLQAQSSPVYDNCWQGSGISSHKTGRARKSSKQSNSCTSIESPSSSKSSLVVPDMSSCLEFQDKPPSQKLKRKFSSLPELIPTGKSQNKYSSQGHDNFMVRERRQCSISGNNTKEASLAVVPKSTKRTHRNVGHKLCIGESELKLTSLKPQTSLVFSPPATPSTYPLCAIALSLKRKLNMN